SGVRPVAGGEAPNAGPPAAGASPDRRPAPARAGASDAGGDGEARDRAGAAVDGGQQERGGRAPRHPPHEPLRQDAPLRDHGPERTDRRTGARALPARRPGALGARSKMAWVALIAVSYRPPDSSARGQL